MVVVVVLVVKQHTHTPTAHLLQLAERTVRTDGRTDGGREAGDWRTNQARYGTAGILVLCRQSSALFYARYVVRS